MIVSKIAKIVDLSKQKNPVAVNFGRYVNIMVTTSREIYLWFLSRCKVCDLYNRHKIYSYSFETESRRNITGSDPHWKIECEIKSQCIKKSYPIYPLFKRELNEWAVYPVSPDVFASPGEPVSCYFFKFG